MEPLQLTKPWTEFKKELQAFMEEGKSLKDMPAQTQQDIAAMENAIDAWDQQVKLWLESSFNASRNRYMIAYHNAGANNFNIPNQNLTRDRQLFLLGGRIQTRTDTLFMLERVLSVSDAVISPETVNLMERAGFTIKQKQEFILRTLYTLYDDFYYPLPDILSGCGIVMKRSSESAEIATMLEDLGYVDQINGAGAAVQIRLTAAGAQMLEESAQPITESYDDIRYSYEEMSAKLDEITEELKKSNLGHEILFDELQDLKKLYLKLNKKNWGQLLKGKLVDVAIGKLVDNSTLALVYEAITHHKFNLLS